MELTRRDLLKGSLAAGGLLIARQGGALAKPLGPADAYGTSRVSPLAPGYLCVHADMHNHTLFSDGDGDPVEAFVSMRDAGLDVAALTDHTTISDTLPESPCLPFALLGQGHQECQSLAGMNETTWQVTADLAARNSVPDEFLAIRGFEWSSPTLGHMNVWFSQEFTDPLHTGGLGTADDLALFAAGEDFPAPQEVLDALQDLVEATPAAGLGMKAWYEWLKADPSTPALGGGADGVFGFNHPGREAGRFSGFEFDQGLIDRCVSLELFNRREDYLFERTDDLGIASPLVACLDAGWRPGILGVTDEHGTDWGFPDGKGRAGLYVTGIGPDAVREALLARRFYATNLKGLRLFATANGHAMGSSVPHQTGEVEIAIDVDRGRAWWGRELGVQILGTGSPLPTVVEATTITVPRGGQQPPTITVCHDLADGEWLVVRITDPTLPADGRADATYESFGGAIAYASPFYLTPWVQVPVNFGGRRSLPAVRPSMRSSVP